MSFEKSSRNPLVNFLSDVQNQSGDSFVSFFFRFIDGFQEEEDEGFKGVLIHVVHDT